MELRVAQQFGVQPVEPVAKPTDCCGRKDSAIAEDSSPFDQGGDPITSLGQVIQRSQQQDRVLRGIVDRQRAGISEICPEGWSGCDVAS